MRVFIAVLVFLCGLTGQAEAFLDGPNCKIYWNAYVLGNGETVAASHSGSPMASSEAAAGRPEAGHEGNRLLLGLTITPPPGQYLYSLDSTDGLPTRVDVDFAPLAAFPMSKMTSRQIAELLEKSGAPVPVRAPAPVPKKDTPFASVNLPGSENSNPDIYPGPVTFWAEVPLNAPGLGGAAIRVNMSGLLCSASSCTPASGTL